MTEAFLFTPLMLNGERARFTLDLKDFIKVSKGLARRGPWRAVITDHPSEKKYGVRGRACGFKCFCDAEVTMECK